MSKIEWTEKTWNPVAGCTWASAGCDHCYAAVMTRRLAAMGQADYAGLTTVKHFNGKIRTLPDKLDIPLRRKKPTMWFVNSMSDLFHKDVPFEFIDQVFAVMALCPQHTFQVLTKRPERMAEYLSHVDRGGFLYRHVCRWLDDGAHGFLGKYWDRAHDLAGLNTTGSPPQYPLVQWNLPLSNVWLGTSVENQEQADKRIPHLLQTPAAVRFLSCEPLLGAVDLRLGVYIDKPLLRRIVSRALQWLSSNSHEIASPQPFDRTTSREEVLAAYSDCAAYEKSGIVDDCIRFISACKWMLLLPQLDWVICGGESGHQARPMHPDWARSLRDQCVAAGVPFFFKQWGEWEPAENYWSCQADGDAILSQLQTLQRNKHLKWWSECGGQITSFPGCVVSQEELWRYRDSVMVQSGKKSAGRQLDGREWNEMPEVSRG